MQLTVFASILTETREGESINKNLDGLKSIKESRRLQSDCELMVTRNLDDQSDIHKDVFA